MADTDLLGDASTATVHVTEVVASDVLIVGVGALLALSEGGYAVEVPAVVAGGAGTLHRVEVGAILDGRAEITTDLAEGAEVVIAR